jgi:hypothetical protein
MTTPVATALLLLSFMVGVTATGAAQPTTPADGSPAAMADEHAAEPGRDESMGERAAVILPGQDDLVADIVGRGETFPGECRFSGGQVDRSLIRATYKCSGGEVVFELLHPSTAPAGATTTAQFALVLRSGAPPPGFTDALVSRVRSREGAFQWKWLGPTHGGSPASTLLIVAVGVLALVVLIWAVRARASARRIGPR